MALYLCLYETISRICARLMRSFFPICNLYICVFLSCVSHRFCVADFCSTRFCFLYTPHFPSACLNLRFLATTTFIKHSVSLKSDLHILKFFVNETGMFLPRRLTMATRRQQTRAFKAVKQAQGMAVFPFDWRPPDTEQMIMQDPMQVLKD